MILLIIFVALLLLIWQLRRIETRLEDIAKQIYESDSSLIHDTNHPAFSVRQLRFAQKQFVEERQKLRNLEYELYKSEDWINRENISDMPSPALRDKMTTVCEAIVQSECAWKMYVFMVEGNLTVASGRDSRTHILKLHDELMKETEGTPVLMHVTPNLLKVQRVNKLLENWVARLAGEDFEDILIDIPK